MTIVEIRKIYPFEAPFQQWTKTSPLELPRGWHEIPAPGIDSGSLAVSLALTRPGTVIVIGADGVMGGDHTTEYHYRWHQHPPKQKIHQRHRRSLVELARKNPDRIKIQWNTPDPDLETIDAINMQSWLNQSSTNATKKARHSPSQK
jgi:hypothetical protein